MKKFTAFFVLVFFVFALFFTVNCRKKTPTTPAPTPTPQSWTNVGGAEVDPGAAYDGQIVVSGGTTYVAFVDYSTSNYGITVMKYNGTSWVDAGSPGFTTGSVSDGYYSLFAINNTLYLATTDSSTGNITIYQLSGNNWVTLGTSGFAVGSFDEMISMAVLDNVLYISYIDSSGALHAAWYNSSNLSWVDLGTICTYAENAAMVVYNNTLYIAYDDDNNNYLSLMYYNGTNWLPVTNTTVTIDEQWDPVMTVSNGNLYLIYYNSTYGAVVMTLNTNLQSVGTLGSISNGDDIESVSGCVYNGVPYVAFDDEAQDSMPNPEAATVKYYNNGSWQLYAGYPNSCDIEDTWLTVDQSSGHLYLTYSDCNGDMTVQVH